MRKIVVLAIALGLSASAGAQTVSLTNVLDTATDNGGVNVYAATYSVADNKFLSSSGGTAIRIYNGNTGAFESNLNMTGITISGLGIFALTSGTDGSIFAFADTTAILWQWANVSAAPVQAASTVPFSRSGHVVGTGNSTKVALTGEADSGPIYIYGTTDDITYTQAEVIPGAALPSKSSFAINPAIDKGWAVGDTASPITKATKSGPTWSADALFVPPAGSVSSAAEVFDSVNNVLFAFQTTTVYALHGDTGAQLGSATVTNGINSVPGYSGAIVSPTAGGGTLWLAGRGTTPSNAVLQKFTYTVTPASGVTDWSVY